MLPTRLGQVVYVSRGYTVAEVLELREEGPALAGYSLFGRGTDPLKVLTKEAALAELQRRVRELGDLIG